MRNSPVRIDLAKAATAYALNTTPNPPPVPIITKEMPWRVLPMRNARRVD